MGRKVSKRSTNHYKNLTKKRLTKKRLTKKRLTKKRLTKKRLIKKRLTNKRLTKKRLTKKRLTNKRLTKRGGAMGTTEGSETEGVEKMVDMEQGMMKEIDDISKLESMLTKYKGIRDDVGIESDKINGFIEDIEKKIKTISSQREGPTMSDTESDNGSDEGSDEGSEISYHESSPALSVSGSSPASSVSEPSSVSDPSSDRSQSKKESCSAMDNASLNSIHGEQDYDRVELHFSDKLKDCIGTDDVVKVIKSKLEDGKGLHSIIKEIVKPHCCNGDSLPEASPPDELLSEFTDGIIVDKGKWLVNSHPKAMSLEWYYDNDTEQKPIKIKLYGRRGGKDVCSYVYLYGNSGESGIKRANKDSDRYSKIYGVVPDGWESDIIRAHKKPVGIGHRYKPHDFVYGQW